MISRSLFLTLGLALLYSAALKGCFGDIPRSGFTQHQANVIRVERVWHRKAAADTVLVGTSLAARLPGSALGSRFDSIAQSATGPMTGLKLVERMPHAPRLLYVELNMLHQGLDHEVLDYFGSEPMASLRSWLPLLRQSEQPVNLFLSWVTSRRPEAPAAGDESRLATGLAYLKPQNETEMSPDVLKSKIEELKRCLAGLRSRGVEIVLVEFPVHPQVRASRRYTQNFNALSEAFPDRDWAWVRPPMDKDWPVTDGLHLTSAAAEAFARVLAKDQESR